MPLRFRLWVLLLVFGGLVEMGLAIPRREWLYATGGACGLFLGFALTYIAAHLESTHRGPGEDSTTPPDAPG